MVQAAVKKYKTQCNNSAEILPSEEFEGKANDFKAMLWELAESHIKGSATINGNITEINYEQPLIKVQPIKQAQMTTLASGGKVVQVVICIYGQKIAKQADYAKVMTAL
ncbi:hypothetical protein HDU80_002062 [Chytriomyces hyalinus]|nr:hypothetical protein HDU80_002062 [Chytriomyces hyalinus]